MAQPSQSPPKRGSDSSEDYIETREPKRGKYPTLAALVKSQSSGYCSPSRELPSPSATESPKSQQSPRGPSITMGLSWDGYHKLSEKQTASFEDIYKTSSCIFLVLKKPTTDQETTDVCEVLALFETWNEALEFLHQHRKKLDDRPHPGPGPFLMQWVDDDIDGDPNQILLETRGTKWDMAIVQHWVLDDDIGLGEGPEAIEICRYSDMNILRATSTSKADVETFHPYVKLAPTRQLDDIENWGVMTTSAPDFEEKKTYGCVESPHVIREPERHDSFIEMSGLKISQYSGCGDGKTAS